MTAETDHILEWTLVSECQIPSDVSELLVPGEIAAAAYETFLGSATFTNKRLIVRDPQAVNGKEVGEYSLPYRSILMYSFETIHGLSQFSPGLELWTKAGRIKVNLSKGIDIRRLDKLIAECIL